MVTLGSTKILLGNGHESTVRIWVIEYFSMRHMSRAAVKFPINDEYIR